MTTYYVRVTGSNAAAGTSAGAAWLTISYAMTHVAAGDTIYVGAGTYRVSAAIVPTSMASMTYLYGDTDGSKTGDAGEVIVTNYATNDTTAPTNVNLFTLDSKNFWTIGKLSLMAGSNGYGFRLLTATHDVTLQDLTIHSTGSATIGVNAITFGTAVNLIVERCRLLCANSQVVEIDHPTSASGSDTNQNEVIRNCLLIGSGVGIYLGVTGTAAKRSGGLTVENCEIIAASCVETSTANTSLTSTDAVYNCLLVARTNGIKASGAGQIVDNYNVIVAATALTNVTQGANTIINGSRMWRFSLGHEASYGGVTRPFGEPPVGSPLLTFGFYAGNTDDIAGAPRPGSGASSVAGAVGAFERSNSGTRSATQHATTDSLAITGPGYHDFDLQVAATATSVKLWVRWDATYAGTKPSMSVRNGGQCGVVAATTTATGTATNWEQLTLTFTPTATGIVTIRLTSSDTNGAGVTLFGDRTVA